MMDAASLPPFVSNAMVYVLISHIAFNTILFAGIALGISWFQRINVCPSFVGFDSELTGVL